MLNSHIESERTFIFLSLTLKMTNPNDDILLKTAKQLCDEKIASWKLQEPDELVQEGLREAIANGIFFTLSQCYSYLSFYFDEFVIVTEFDMLVHCLTSTYNPREKIRITYSYNFTFMHRDGYKRFYNNV